MKPDLFSFALALSLCLGASVPAQAQADFAEIIRTTDPLPAQEQLKRFHLPPGFEIQLVASEPDIAKPMNIAFDAQGRLWLTQSRDYPFPSFPIEKGGQDEIKVLENFSTHGRAEKITTFAVGLNIPIGILPYQNGALAFSIPNIYRFTDTDGDGRADESKLFLGRFGFEKDTHGMTSHFRRGYDGRLYADHGFNNDSTLRASDGSQIQLNSGNTYRIRINGTEIEQFTWGQVNPFGLMLDHLGDLWSSDCHSSPVYQLLRGAYYPSFGKPHDGLGFAPNICAHAHESTAIAGMVFYDAAQFPEEFRHNTFVGNVMTCRINRDSYIQRGSTRIAKEEPDFLRCDDPWFRPVDLQLGPDGALYIADFYNRIIGHYEVPLSHPGRDRERGRIWRVVYVGDSKQATNQSVSHQLTLPSGAEQLLEEMGNDNIARRMLALNELTDRLGATALQPLYKVAQDPKANSHQRALTRWALYRLGNLDHAGDREKWLHPIITDPDALVRVHALRILSELKNWTTPEGGLVRHATLDSDPYVCRAAADALGQHPSGENVFALLALRHRVPGEDSQLLHTVRMALRNQLRHAEIFESLTKRPLQDDHSRAIADVAIAVTNPIAARFLLQHVKRFPSDRDQMAAQLRHIARYSTEDGSEIAQFSEEKFSDDVDFQLALLQAVREGMAQRGAELSSPVREWATRLVAKAFPDDARHANAWQNIPDVVHETDSPWFMQPRDSEDGVKGAPFICSLPPGGEQLTGTLRSPTFTVPPRLTFFMAGHDGSPDKPAQSRNYFQLVESRSGEVLMRSAPPRNDMAQPFSWDLAAHAGKIGVLEIVDGDTGTGYAWLAVGRIEPNVVPWPSHLPGPGGSREQFAAEISGALQLKQFAPDLLQLLRRSSATTGARVAAAQSLRSFDPVTAINAFDDLLTDSRAPMRLREAAAEALADAGSVSNLLHAAREAPRTLQLKIATTLAEKHLEKLLAAVESRGLPARLLQEKPIRDRFENKGESAKARLAKLLDGLTPLSVEKQKLIDERRAQFAANRGDATAGAGVFEKSCAVCHQIAQQGALIGPQLDGVGGRGADRLLEDILDPNRNVDHAFRTTLLLLKDGEAESGLVRREEGEMLILADATGREVSIPKASIKERREGETSLMPENFADVLSAAELNNLIAFLLKKSAAPR